MQQIFDDSQISQLNAPLDLRLVKERQGSSGMLSYIEGHCAIDQANRLFGYGNWAFRTLSCEQAVLIDPTDGLAVGVAYKAQVELVVRGAVAPIVEVGSQPVTAWNVRDVVMNRRGKNADREKPIEEWEKIAAQKTIVESHENAEKSSVTDTMKRCLRTYGNQFGNGLYGNGQVDLESEQLHEQNPAPRRSNDVISPSQISSVKNLCKLLSRDVAPDIEMMSAQNARETIAELSKQWKQKQFKDAKAS